jgi:AraC-like DNA-binding protein/quercetin dioxygenase-like cupin family protein
MDNELSDFKTTEMLLSPGKWKLVTSFLPEEVPPVSQIALKESEEKKFKHHFAREILVPLTGEYCYGFNGKCYNCVPGAIFLIDSNIEHEAGYTRYSNHLIHLWMFVEHKQVLSQYLTIHHGKIEYKRKIAINDFAADMNLYDLWENLQCATGKYEIFLARHKFILALAMIFVKIVEREKTDTDKKTYQKMMVEMVKSRIQENFRQGISIAQLTRIGGYSKFYFLRLFKQYSGYTVYEYLNLCRINEMKRLLQKNLSQKEISMELGFSCSASFSNWRKKIMREISSG